MSATPTPAPRALIPPEENRRMFNGIAGRYDLLNTVMSCGRDRAWRRRAIDTLQPRPGGVYVDAGCGTGALCRELAGRFPPGALTVQGVDFSEAMLAEGSRRLAQTNLAPSITLRQGDALALPLADNSCDGVVSAFVLRNLDDRPAALRDWGRVLRPGGRCVILELAVPEKPLARIGYRLCTRLLVPTLAGLLSRRRAYVYLLDSIQAFPAPAMVCAWFCEAGFTAVQTTPLTFGAVRLYQGIKSE
jgi:demethylmenaquinone methyltransferase/2-methoxy-6-polyprenyl-1,4-benzoquinol methylase